MTRGFEIAVIGAGIAGASVAAHLAQAGKSVALLEMESQAGYHTTGRSAAIFAPSYGPASIRALTRASEAFFLAPPDGFANAAIFSPREIMMIARADQSSALDALIQEVMCDQISELGPEAVRERNPLLREGYAQRAMLDSAGQDIDVDALHQGYLRMFKAAGGTFLAKSEVVALERADQWQVETKSGPISAGVVVNAAGAWAGVLGEMAGAEDIGLTPKQRTALMVAAPAEIDLKSAPLTIDIEEQFYLKPDAGRLLISPADETPSAPCDAQPDEMDVAICVDRIETAFDLQVRRIENKWAGLRSFARDKAPVVGFSQKADGLFWLAGQGGYGIQTSPAMAHLAASMILGESVPSYVTDTGLNLSEITPERFTAIV